MTSEENNDTTDDGEAVPGEIILNHSLNTEMKNSYINYAMSVIIGRALPDARDGLKPVHRRVLYGMFEGGHTADKKFSKSARSVGEVMGKYHPHGDQSIYDTMVRMAQEFSLRYPLVDGQGNFGSIDGDPPAAMRYTESRLDRIAKHMLDDINKNTVDFQPNFDDSENEPSVLPARLPNLLLNGSDGIAVGMATRIPPHNLTEVAGAVNLHVDTILESGTDEKPSISIEEYMQHVKGPDFPTGAPIHGIDGIADMYATGKGRFHVRAKCDVFDDDKGKRIVVHEIPYQVKKADMLVQIADLVNKEVVIGIRDIRDESSKEGIRVVIEVKNNADPHAVLLDMPALAASRPTIWLMAGMRACTSIYLGSVTRTSWHHSPAAGIGAALAPRRPPGSGSLRSSASCSMDSRTSGSKAFFGCASSSLAMALSSCAAVQGDGCARISRSS